MSLLFVPSGADTITGKFVRFSTFFLTKYPSTSPTPNTTVIVNNLITRFFLSPPAQLQLEHMLAWPWLSRFLYSMSMFSESASHLETCFPAVYLPLEGILKKNEEDRWSKQIKLNQNKLYNHRSFIAIVYTVELQWLEHLWDHGKLFEPWVVRAKEC